MKRNILSIFLILACFLIIDNIGGWGMKKAVENTQDLITPKLEYLFKHCQEDIITIGTSRCHSHYVPSIIADSTLLSVYNGGIQASSSILSHYIVLSNILERHKPQLILLDVSIEDYRKEENDFQSIGFFAPYFGLSKNADSVYQDAGVYYSYLFSHLFRYNAKAIPILAGLIKENKENQTDGFLPLKAIPFTKTTHTIKKGIPSQFKLKYFERFIQQCNEANIKLFIAVSPHYYEETQDAYEPLEKIAEKYNIPFKNYNNTKTDLLHPCNFKDSYHLSYRGAQLFSQQVASDLKRFIKENP